MEANPVLLCWPTSKTSLFGRLAPSIFAQTAKKHAVWTVSGPLKISFGLKSHTRWFRDSLLFCDNPAKHFQVDSYPTKLETPVKFLSLLLEQCFLKWSFSSTRLIFLPSTPRIHSLRAIPVHWPFFWRSIMVPDCFYSLMHTIKVTFSLKTFPYNLWNLSIRLSVRRFRPPIVLPSESFVHLRSLFFFLKVYLPFSFEWDQHIQSSALLHPHMD